MHACVRVRLEEVLCGSSPQVFLREAARQRLQALLHGEVLRLVVALQRRFRARLERRLFVSMRGAAIRIQVRNPGAGPVSGSQKVGFLLSCVKMKASFRISNLTG